MKTLDRSRYKYEDSEDGDALDASDFEESMRGRKLYEVMVTVSVEYKVYVLAKSDESARVAYTLSDYRDEALDGHEKHFINATAREVIDPEIEVEDHIDFGYIMYGDSDGETLGWWLKDMMMLRDLS